MESSLEHDGIGARLSHEQFDVVAVGEEGVVVSEELLALSRQLSPQDRLDEVAEVERTENNSWVFSAGPIAEKRRNRLTRGR